jgi:hypothetical protein
MWWKNEELLLVRMEHVLSLGIKLGTTEACTLQLTIFSVLCLSVLKQYVNDVNKSEIVS